MGVKRVFKHNGRVIQLCAFPPFLLVWVVSVPGCRSKVVLLYFILVFMSVFDVGIAVTIFSFSSRCILFCFARVSTVCWVG